MVLKGAGVRQTRNSTVHFLWSANKDGLCRKGCDSCGNHSLSSSLSRRAQPKAWRQDDDGGAFNILKEGAGVKLTLHYCQRAQHLD